MSKAGKRLIESAEQALEFVSGKSDTSPCRVTIPSEIDVKQVRERLKMRPQDFAATFGFDLAILADWEQGRRVPTGLARNFLMLLQRDPEGVRKILSGSES
jgi:putative transcriptional regulator